MNIYIYIYTHTFWVNLGNSIVGYPSSYALIFLPLMKISTSKYCVTRFLLVFWKNDYTAYIFNFQHQQMMDVSIHIV